MISETEYYEIKKCRSCGNPTLQQIYSYGKVPLANALVKKEDENRPDKLYPMNLMFCPSCSLVQIKETIKPEILFKNYLYFSSYSDTMLKHVQELVKKVVIERKLGPNSLVIEIASNDGYLLQYFKEKNIPILGIEPAENIAKIANEKGIPTIPEFFSYEFAKKLTDQGRMADIIIGNNVLAHIADLSNFIKGIKIILKADGIGSFEFPYAVELFKNNEFDTVYHEHLCYFSFNAVINLFKQFNLKVVDVERTTIHGGSLRITIMHDKSNPKPPKSVLVLLNEEKTKGLLNFDYYQNFAKRIAEIKRELLALLQKLKKDGRRVAAYGAAAKGTILLNVFEIDKNFIDFVADKNPHKQNLYMPHNHIPVVGPEKLLEKKPDYVLILAWNFADEIIAQQAEYRQGGGKFIIPIPKVKIV